MKYLSALLFALLLSVNAIAGTLSAPEVTALSAKIDEMMAMYQKGDAQALVAETHPSAYKIAGSKELFEKGARKAIADMAQYGIKFISSENGTPSKTYKAGDEEVCFVPRVSLMEVGGQKVRSAGFMVAIRQAGGTQWKFLDGAGIADNPGLLYTLLPKLERGITLPPHGVGKP